MTESDFLITGQYRRFIEFCDSCRSKRYIGVVYGKPGVGKTESARHYAQWHLIEPLLGKPSRHRLPPNELAGCTAAFYTPDVSVTAKRLHGGISILRNKFDDLIDQAVMWHGGNSERLEFQARRMNLLIVDEADRLKFQALEQLRDLYDRTNLGIVLMGMPGFQKKLSRYPQLYSRVGFLYEFKPLSKEEARAFIAQKWQHLGLPLSADDAVSSAIVRITNGNFRSLHRVFTEIERLQKLNCLPVVTPEVIETARQTLLLGAT